MTHPALWRTRRHELILNPRSGRRRGILAIELFLVLILLVASIRTASGDPVSAEQATAAVRGWLRADRVPLQTTVGQRVKRVETFNDAKGAVLYHVVYLDPEGFVIVAADDLIEPIVCFASGGKYDPSTNNPLGALVSNDLPGRIAQVKGIGAANAQGLPLEARNKWGRLKDIEEMAPGVEAGIPGVSDVRVSPLVQSKWDQLTVGGAACYNYFTPPYSSGSAGNYYCGCVATAMAQLMRYYQYPINGVGTTSFTIYIKGVSTTRSLRGGNGSGSAYSWSDMVLDPSVGINDTQRQAIGALTHDAGVAVHMDYGDDAYGGSGAYMEDVAGALKGTFNYTRAICGKNANSNIGTGLNGMVNPNLDTGCPVLLGIVGPPVGHAIVCDGYGYNVSTLYHHLNLGWSGSYTAWYNLPTIDTGIGTFTNVYACVYNVWTNGTGEIISGRVTDEAGSPIAGVVVTATRSGGGTYTATSNAQGIYALARIPSSSQYTLSASKAGYHFANQIVTTGQSTDYSSSSGNLWAVNFTATATFFVTTGSLATGRYSHTATLLPNGKVLVAGGYDGSSYLSSAELYDPATGTWTATGSLTTARGSHTATLLPNGQVLVAGGSGSSGYLSSAELYDPASGTWTARGSLSVARTGHRATLLPNGHVLVAGGSGSSGYLSSAELYDPASETWTTTGALATARDSHTATLLPNGKVLIAGGYNSSYSLSSTELYDPVSGTWTATGALDNFRSNHTATLLPNGKVLVAGGMAGTYLSTAVLYDPVGGTWTATGSLTTARRYHTATLLPNGKVLVVGGHNSNGLLTSVELYDPASGTWTATGSLVSARRLHRTTLLPGGKVLVVGGTGLTVTLSSAEVCDPSSGTWTATSALAIARSQHTATLLSNGKALVAGGYNGDYLSSTELYDPVSGTWTATGALAAPRYAHTATLLPDGKVLVAGGYSSGSIWLSGAELYDPAAGTWTTNGSMALARSAHTATLLPNGKVLVAGGYNGSYLSSAELYDPATGTWTTTGPLSTARYYHTATLLPNGKVLVAGGVGGGVSLASAELYDPSTGLWTTTGALTSARNAHTATLLPNGKVLVAAGYNGTSYLTSAELYNPAMGTWTATGSMTAARYLHTATSLPNGKVLVAGGYDGINYLTSAELYDSAMGIWTTTGTMASSRRSHTATLLPNGKVLIAGSFNGSYLSSAELYDVGLGFNASWQPQIAAFTSPLSLGNSLTLTGSRFRGVSEGSGGNSPASSTDYPVVQLRSLESGKTLFLLPTNWSIDSFTSGSVTGLPPGYALATVFVNGIPSTSSILLINSPPTITTSSLLPSGTVGLAYSQTLTVTGGTPPYTWVVVSNNLPSGLTLAAGSGAITGTPTVATTAGFRVRVTGADTLYSEQNFTLTVSPALTPFQTWQFQYFDCTNCPQAMASADPDGDGQNNEAEFLTGTCPTSSLSAFRILSITPESNNLRVTWQTVGGKTNTLQATGAIGSTYTNVSPNLIILGTGDTTTNWLDPGAGTNWPARFYRIRLVP